MPDASVTNQMDQDVLSSIAIIGLSFQFPQASSTEAFWELMMSGKRTATQFPPNRLSDGKYHRVDHSSRNSIDPQKANFVKTDISAFDAHFFNMPSDEASGTDPQHRMLLETTYRAFENAGITMNDINGSNTSVHAGSFTADYTLAAAKDPVNSSRYSATGMARCMLSNRISRFFNLVGPSVTIDTACSSSLVALDMACKSLAKGESEIGVVAGSNLLLTPDYFISLSNLGFLSPDGICYSFDNRANGYSRGEGVGVIILKPLLAALQNGDTIRAVIRASGTNQNGQTSLALPSKEMQMQLMKDTYQKANIDMSATRFIEAHGTGTAAGDPLEAMAIASTFSRRGKPNGSIIVGALKANIGHLEGAAGIAGVIKTILVLERGIIPPIAGLQELNSDIDAEFFNLEFPRTPMVWPCQGLRRASVNSFGFGGTNAHVILDDALHFLQIHGLRGNHCTVPSALENAGFSPRSGSLLDATPNLEVDYRHPSTTSLFVWSANDRDAACRMLKSYAQHLELELASGGISDRYLEFLAHTLIQRRTLQTWRAFIVADSVPQLIDRLHASQSIVKLVLNPRAGFVFTGQGSQWQGMGKELASFPVFMKSILDANQYLQTIGCKWDVTSKLFGEAGKLSDINEPRFSQPLCTILQVALVELLWSLGIYPAVVVGHSSGEIAAAFTCGAICRQSAWKLAYFRGLVSSKMVDSSEPGNTGAMMVAGRSANDLYPYINGILRDVERGVLCVACYNSPTSTTVSGDEPLIRALQAKLDAAQIFTRILKIPVAYHSPHMLKFATLYRELIGSLTPGLSPSDVTMVSSVTGHEIAATELLQGEYWVRNLVAPVNFVDAVRHVCRHAGQRIRKKLNLSHRNSMSVSDMIEIGPHSTLRGPIREVMEMEGLQMDSISYTPTLVRSQSGIQTLLKAIGKLHCRGFNVDLSHANNPHGRRPHDCMVLTTLPEYPFDDSKTYWHEPRISQNMRLHNHTQHELLGVPVSDWNLLEPRWRNTLKTSTLPWLEDHKINGEIIFPAAGMFVMAIEAVMLVSEGQNITGYEIRDATILSALAIPPGDKGIEIHFRLKFSYDSSDKSDAWAEFCLFSYHDSNFTEVCRGSIRTTTARGDQIIPVGGNYSSCSVTSASIPNGDAYETEIALTELYKKLYDNGYGYGPTFQGIRRVRWDGHGRAFGEVSTRPAVKPLASSLIIHPCTLDTLLQLILPAVVWADTDMRATWVPTYLHKLSLSTSGLNDLGNTNMHVFTSTKARSSRLCTSTVHATRRGDGVQLLQVEGIEMTIIADELNDSDDTTSKETVRRLCYDRILKPNLSMLNNDQVTRYARGDTSAKPDPIEFLETLKLYILTLMSRTANTVYAQEIPVNAPHLQMQYSWMERTIVSMSREPPYGVPSDWSDYVEDSKFNTLCDRLKSTGRLGEIYVEFGTYLVDIFRGERDALETLLEGNILKEYYDLFNQDVKFFGPLHTYLDTLAHKNPGMKILEVGAGTGATTRHILNTLAINTLNGPFCRFSQYDFTDISPSFLEKASTEFGKLSKMNFRLFDVENNPIEQGYDEDSYDLVIAVNVLHGTKSLQDSLTNVRKLLTKDGKLIVVEITDPDSMIGHSIFGFLPGWWQSTEIWRRNGPIASLPQWCRELQLSGFTGIDSVFHDFDSEKHRFASLFVSSTVDPSPVMDHYVFVENKIAFVIAGFDDLPPESAFTRSIISKLGEAGIADVRPTTFHRLAKHGLAGDELVVVAEDHNWQSFANMDAEAYAIFHSVLISSKNIMWMSAVTPGTEKSPSSGIIQGLTRTLRRENYGLVFSTVALDPSLPVFLRVNVGKALHNFLQGVNTGTYERELVQVGEFLHIPRLYECDELNGLIHTKTSKFVERKVPFGEQNIKLKVHRPGLLDTLYFQEAERQETIGPDEIEVQVRAIGVNFRDCLIALGRVDQDTIGTECAGVVVQTGSNCQLLRAGDHVLVSTVDTFQSYVRCSEKLAVRIPGGMTFTDAGALATNFVTAYHSLITIGRLSRGDSVLIHSGAGGTGQAAIQIAKICGANIFTTVGSSSKRKLLSELYGIPLDHILNSRDLSFADQLKKFTCGKGVDVVLNSLTGDALIASWECVAPYGRFVEIGKKDIYSHKSLPMFQFARNVSFCAVDLASMTEEKPVLIQDALRYIIDGFNRGVLQMPSPQKSFPISEIESAFRYLQTGNNPGKVVIEVEPQDVVPAMVKPKSNWNFSSNETIVIAGGLGAQGRSVAKWLALKGARHIVLLSRSGPRTRDSQDFVNDLRKDGVNVHCPPCDVADYASLSAVLEHCKTSMPPIKGCIHAAMELQDGLFETMNYRAWSSSLRPKVDGSWNLHRLLPRDLGFFIMFSSIAGMIGSQGQSNYAAGNVFQDELAKYRISQGEKAISINFSLLADTGYAADNHDAAMQFIKTRHVIEMSQAEVLAVLEHYCDKSLTHSPERSQLVTGLANPHDITAAGIEATGWMQEPVFANLHQINTSSTLNSTGESAQNLEADLASRAKVAETLEGAAQILAEGLATKLCKILTLSRDGLDLSHPLHMYGVDSLIAVELRSWFLRSFKVDITVFEILGGATAESLGRTLAGKVWTKA
ncbi:putative polyketide synthase [Hypomontagnella monticulosa]|nr:putative polyketide synthase [Hypomontagnella monticulosa]